MGRRIQSDEAKGKPIESLHEEVEETWSKGPQRLPRPYNRQPTNKQKIREVLNTLYSFIHTQTQELKNFCIHKFISTKLTYSHTGDDTGDELKEQSPAFTEKDLCNRVSRNLVITVCT